MIGSALLAALPALTAAELREHNPSGAPVTEVHMVLSSHFDAGCKTPGCGEIVEGEPKVCAKVGAGNAHGATDPFVRPCPCPPAPAPHTAHTDSPAPAPTRSARGPLQGTGEPWAYHIVNRYFDEFIPRAIAPA